MSRSPEPTAADALAADLRVEVLSARLPLGAPLREEEIAARTGHSRHTVRTALARLVAQRLAVAAPYRGVRVVDFSDDDVVALQQLRGALEAEAVRLLGDRHGHGDATWPDHVLAPAREAVAALAHHRDDDWLAVSAAHAAVHRGLVAAAGSDRVTEAHDALEAELSLVLAHVRPAYDVAALAAEHQAYLHAVERDGPVAVHAHLDHATRIILEARSARG